MPKQENRDQNERDDRKDILIEEVSEEEDDDNNKKQNEKKGFRKHLKRHFSQPENLFDIMAFILHIVTLTTERTEVVDMKLVRICASMCLFCVWWQLLYWLRMFDRTSKYWDMIIETFIDVIYFGLILILMIIMFASCLYLLQINRIVNP